MSMDLKSMEYLGKAITQLKEKNRNGKPIEVDPETNLFIAQVYATLSVSEQLSRLKC